MELRSGLKGNGIVPVWSFIMDIPFGKIKMKGTDVKKSNGQWQSVSVKRLPMPTNEWSLKLLIMILLDYQYNTTGLVTKLIENVWQKKVF